MNCITCLKAAFRAAFFVDNRGENFEFSVKEPSDLPATFT